MLICMTENGDLLENATAERVNGIIKDEYLDNYQVSTNNQDKVLLKAVIELYNTERPHMSISNFTPKQIYQSKTKIQTEKLWKNYYRENTTIVNFFQDESLTCFCQTADRRSLFCKLIFVLYN